MSSRASSRQNVKRDPVGRRRSHVPFTFTIASRVRSGPAPVRSMSTQRVVGATVNSWCWAASGASVT